MSVYIKNEKMPKCCDQCWALDDDGDYPRCRITEEQRGYTFRTYERVMDKCPLIEVKDKPVGDVFGYEWVLDWVLKPLIDFYYIRDNVFYAKGEK